MSSRIQSDLVLVDGALRSSPSRAQLKGSSVDAWAACNASLLAVLPILQESVLADQGGSVAAISMYWRKSSAGKKLLALLRAVVEEAHALQGEAAHAAAAHSARCHAVHGSISVISFFWQHTQQSAALWPAMREWIVELGGVTSLWTALAWAARIPMRGCEAAANAVQELRASVHSVLALTHGMFTLRRPVELAQNSAVTTVMSSVLSDLLPRDFSAGNARKWDLDVVFCAVTRLYRLEGSMLSAHLHKPLLIFWPYLNAEMRRQQRQLVPESVEASELWLCGLKVHTDTGNPNFGSLYPHMSHIWGLSCSNTAMFERKLPLNAHILLYFNSIAASPCSP